MTAHTSFDPSVSTLPAAIVAVVDPARTTTPPHHHVVAVAFTKVLSNREEKEQ